MPLLRDLPTVASAYLRSHTTNPVDWWVWGEDAFAEAARRNVPVFLSVGYAACHWCHVMAHESFEDPAIGDLLRDNFIAIKVDREERPDIDQVYMAATQLISGHGGWPMSVFLLPDGRPFTAGTYYPPTDRPGLVGFPRLLGAITEAWRERHDDVVAQADTIQQALRREVGFIDFLGTPSGAVDLAAVRATLATEIGQRTDEHGGHGAPRFPRPSYVRALLHHDPDAATTILRSMAFSGLYDHLGGGFARYSVDAHWDVPHFEQMLSDQALLARAYLEAAAVLDAPEWREVATDVIAHVLRRFAVPAGFASSLDADADGVEGSHLTWTPREVREALTAAGVADLTEASLARWSITDEGNLEGRSVPRLAEGEPFLTPPPLELAREALATVRAARPQPARDEKVILEWNAMFASALLATDNPLWHDRGLSLLRSLSETHVAGGRWWRTEQCTTQAGAADVAWYLDACVDAFSLTGADEWLDRGRAAAQYLVDHFWDGPSPTPAAPDLGRGIFANADTVTDLFTRPKDIFDGATPSSHAVATRALARLALVTGDTTTLVVAQRLVTVAQELVRTHPMAVVDLVDAAGFALEGVEIVVPGDRNELSDHVRLHPMPRAVLIPGTGASPLLRERRAGLAYVCRAGSCHLPVSTVDDLQASLDEVSRGH